MRKEGSFKSFGIGVLLRLSLLVAMGSILVVVHTYMVHSGVIPISLSLNAVTHFLLFTIIGIINNIMSGNGKNIAMISAAGILYLLLMMLAVVVFDGLQIEYLYSVLGGGAGFLVSVLMQFAGKRKGKGWNSKKYHC